MFVIRIVHNAIAICLALVRILTGLAGGICGGQNIREPIDYILNDDVKLLLIIL